MIDLLDVRQARTDDVGELLGILNRLIDAGGTTALEIRLTQQEFERLFLNGPTCLACFIAMDPSGRISGFQASCTRNDLPPDYADIATFSRQNPRALGTGTALFFKSVEFLRERGFRHINAKIRADNVPGLAYYAKMGFLDHAIAKKEPLLDGSLIDRVTKRYRISPPPHQP